MSKPRNVLEALVAEDFSQLPKAWQDFITKSHPALVKQIKKAQQPSKIQQVTHLKEEIESLKWHIGKLEDMVDYLNDKLDQSEVENSHLKNKLNDALLELEDNKRLKNLPLDIRWV